MAPLHGAIAPYETYRKTDHKYGEADRVRQKFTGYQNDAETGLDFAEARMYENRHGRFTAVDPLLASGKSADPQTFNRYVYVMNNPVVLTDPTGLQVGTPKPGELGSDENPYRVNTESRSWWSKIKDGIKDSFNKFIRALAPVDNFYHEEDIDFQERKRGGEDKQVGNALRNYAKGSEELYQAMESVDQTGVLELNRALVNNSLGRASDEEVYGAFGNALLNTALTAAPGGRAAKTAENVSAPVRGWVVRKIFGNLDEPIKKKVVSALKTGIVAPKGKQGVIRLSESEAQKTGYTHKVKILGKGGDLRIYGRQQENGLIVFDKIGKH